MVVTPGSSIEAVALRAADHVRLSRDAKPSLRYMRILLKGARELQLDSNYIQYLESIETSKPSKVLVLLSLLHIKWMFWYAAQYASTFDAIFRKLRT